MYASKEILRSDPTSEKPPLGVMPKYIFEELRVKDLCRALCEYAYNKPDKELMLEWARELCERLEAKA